MAEDKYVLSEEMAEIIGMTLPSLRVTRVRQENRRKKEREQGLPGKYRPTDIPEPEYVGRVPRWKRRDVERWLARRREG